MLFVFYCSNKFTDLTCEERNFLSVSQGLITVVNPVIKNLFTTQVSDQEFAKIRNDMWEQHSTHFCKDSQISGKKSCNKRLYLTDKQHQKLFSSDSKFYLLDIIL